MSTIAPRPGTPEFEHYWYLMQDLGPGPHHYISLYRGTEEVARFNTERREWLSSDDFALRQLCKYLNEHSLLGEGDK